MRSRIDAAFDRVFDALFTVSRRSSGRVVFVLAYAIYLGFGLALPIWLSWPPVPLLYANLFSTLVAGFLALGWFVARFREANARHLVEWTTDLRLLDATEFEWLVGELFRREGWSVEHTGRSDAPDGNVDLVLTKGKERRIVQCKRWTSWVVGVDEIRELAGTLMREGLPGTAGVYVTLSVFGAQAEQEAKRIGLELVDRENLLERVQKAKRAEPCPTCGEGMVLDRSRRGWWLRCVTAGCSGKRDLGSDPVRALEFLTEPPRDLGRPH